MTAANFVAIVTGCGDPYAPQMAVVTGRVLLDGEPLSGARVTFDAGDGRQSKAITGDDGRFTLVDADGGLGAPVGRNFVHIVSQPTSATTSPPDDPYDSGTQLERVVELGENDFTFDLSRTVEAFHGRLVSNGAPVRFDAALPRLTLIHKPTGEAFGIPLLLDGSFSVGWMPLGEYQVVLTRAGASFPGGRPIAGQAGTFEVPDGLVIRADQASYEIELGETWSPQMIEKPLASPNSAFASSASKSGVD